MLSVAAYVKSAQVLSKMEETSVLPKKSSCIHTSRSVYECFSVTYECCLITVARKYFLITGVHEYFPVNVLFVNVCELLHCPWMFATYVFHECIPITVARECVTMPLSIDASWLILVMIASKLLLSVNASQLSSTHECFPFTAFHECFPNMVIHEYFPNMVIHEYFPISIVNWCFQNTVLPWVLTSYWVQNYWVLTMSSSRSLLSINTIYHEFIPITVVHQYLYYAFIPITVVHQYHLPGVHPDHCCPSIPFNMSSSRSRLPINTI